MEKYGSGTTNGKWGARKLTHRAHGRSGAERAFSPR
jgi:hypothetical protein